MMDITYHDVTKILIAFVLGALLGLEREYRSKAAGFRTLIMITVGATVFTLLSYRIGSGTPDRIAANIITGIGFIGAGVIFKEGMKVSGMTTASTIWIAAAIGMSVGYGAYYLAGGVTLLVLVILMLLEKLERSFDHIHQVKFYKISFRVEEYSIDELEKNMAEILPNYRRTKMLKNNNEVILFYKIGADQQAYHRLDNYLMETKAVKSFEV
ncbi:MAG TPA: MgtC/SapB family protein [Ferruginibacter sp.]|nr:MgtC/SapB family protein [Ferruginibacter sp.]